MYLKQYKQTNLITLNKRFFLGDAQLKPFITSEPDISIISLEGTEDFLIIASDGLWESLTEDYIALFIYRKIAENPGKCIKVFSFVLSKTGII